ncbi:hypothetical protein AA13595_0868 [Gluconacetobacter johannae DSM 13595]|uniref:Nuclease n=1 Tax=Gluconacetobacter johannae TaxID=112140 RepID=A0A7W4P4G8_9PROT|nr:hypothetical protein [Gluconacetobacter johannae]MBB2177042.1 hypothetical protein [Gluconacetobacter johannae]GBQ82247.1 hypothetical protein AA13595_0868 [Gluconacetobacter johannae DSM 13595]
MRKIFYHFMFFAFLFPLSGVVTAQVVSARELGSSHEGKLTHAFNTIIADDLASAPTDVKTLVRKESVLDDKCGGEDELATNPACRTRNTLKQQIKARGWCYGPDEAGGKHWLRCSQGQPAADLAHRRPVPARWLDKRSGSLLNLPRQFPLISAVLDRSHQQTGAAQQEEGDDMAGGYQGTYSDGLKALAIVAILALFLMGLIYLPMT